ncbi:unnamed protein product [Arctia plantaginis]|uniref:EGF-like domain-containing protein n=1 Tax=Arctia plantaginis TaxID=874455 RepID=A0A8S1BAQ4_ARCPL|nr:unnamed protein product [Arctia plantaginis]
MYIGTSSVILFVPCFIIIKIFCVSYTEAQICTKTKMSTVGTDFKTAVECIRRSGSKCTGTRTVRRTFTKKLTKPVKTAYKDCCTGYIQDKTNVKTLVCKPVCPKGCQNGSCRKPNECACNKGYKKVEEHVCVPFCSDGCPHGKCVGPEICICDLGYYKNNFTCVASSGSAKNLVFWITSNWILVAVILIITAIALALCVCIICRKYFRTHNMNNAMVVGGQEIKMMVLRNPKIL